MWISYKLHISHSFSEHKQIDTGVEWHLTLFKSWTLTLRNVALWEMTLTCHHFQKCHSYHRPYQTAAANIGQVINLRLWLHPTYTHKLPVHDVSVIWLVDRYFLLFGLAWVCAHGAQEWFWSILQGLNVSPQHTLKCRHVQTLGVSTCCGRKDLLITSNDSGYRVLGREKLHLYSPTLSDRWFILFMVVSLAYAHTNVHKACTTFTHTFVHAALAFFSCCSYVLKVHHYPTRHSDHTLIYCLISVIKYQ